MDAPRKKVNLDNVEWLERAQDFIDTYDFPKELVLDVIRKPDDRVLDPSSEEKGYTVVRCRRGDITVCVGLRDVNHPSIIYVYLHTPEDHVQHGSHAAGWASGGSSKTPKSPQQLRGWLQKEGCRLQFNGRGHYNVYLGDRLLGGIGSTQKAQAVMNDYSFMRKRLAAERVRQQFEQTEIGEQK